MSAAPAPRRRSLAVAAALALFVLGLAAWLIHDRLREAVKVQLSAVMNATLNTAVGDVRAWHDGAQRAADAAGRDPIVRERAARCLRIHECDALQAALVPYMTASGLVAGRAVAAGARIAKGRSANPAPLGSLTIQTKVSALDGAEIGALAFDLPLQRLSDQLGATRVGQSGETYVIDERGHMLTFSRFIAQSQQGGRTLDVRVPTRHGSPGALTHAAQRALAKESGTQLDGYPDYRGVPVVGTWRAMPELGLSVITELDVSDAFRTLGALTRMYWTLAGGLILALAATLFWIRRATDLRARAEQAERRVEQFGQYRIEHKLGEGGMGAVYLADHALLRRKAAIKVLKPDRVSPEALARFEREAQITSALTHPNTISIYDYGRTQEGTFYYVMEYLEGLDLHRLVTRFGPLIQARVIHFLRQVCGSLAEAHAAGIVHRDIKPANLLACTLGGVTDTLKVLDFGIVHVGALDQRSEPIVLGTPEYMAPELFESATRASPQSDLYSLGVVAYFLLTGSPPFANAGPGTTEIGLAHLTQVPEPPSALLGGICDPTLEAAVLACLKKEPSARPASAASLRALLDRSALAGRWTQADAEAWWSERADALRALRTSPSPEDSMRRTVTVRARS